MALCTKRLPYSEETDILFPTSLKLIASPDLPRWGLIVCRVFRLGKLFLCSSFFMNSVLRPYLKLRASISLGRRYFDSSVSSFCESISDSAVSKLVVASDLRSRPLCTQSSKEIFPALRRDCTRIACRSCESVSPASSASAFAMCASSHLSELLERVENTSSTIVSPSTCSPNLLAAALIFRTAVETCSGTRTTSPRSAIHRSIDALTQ
mmetsp:Transcript_13838/g.20410  ORF Transcript_13838/g.20410 Transcript_13838/m.20410 type:complete len:209 (-) Transcript_13838:728-1354(-)